MRTRACVLVLFVLALPGSAQSLARFVPAEAGASASLSLELSFVREKKSGIEIQPWPAREVGWLFVRGEGTQQNHDTLAPQAEDATRLRLVLESPGPSLVGWDLPPRVERMQPAELRAFLAERSTGGAAPRALQAPAAGETVPVLRLESLQLLAGSPTPGRPSAVALGKAGLRMELRALLDPGSAAPGSDVPFRLYLPAGGREDVLARLVHLESRAAEVLALTQESSLRVRPDRPGAWLLEASRVRALDGSAAAQGATLELASITFVFTVPGTAGEKREDKR